MADQRAILISLAKKIGENKLTISTGGNVSARLLDDRMVITPSKQHKSISELEVDDLSIVGLGGGLINGPKPSAEVPMHVAIYRSSPEVVWIVHAHPPIAVAYASERILPETSLTEASRLRLSLVGKEAPGSQSLADEVSRKVKEGSNVVLLEGHGVVVVSNFPEDAYLLLEELESACKTDLARRVLRLKAGPQ